MIAQIIELKYRAVSTAVAKPPSLFGNLADREALRTQADAYVQRAISMLDRAEALVQADRMDAADVLSQRRSALALHFQSYQRFKHLQIFDPVVQHGPASSKVVARTMKVDCVLLGNQFNDYHVRWQFMQSADWHAYKRDMLQTVSNLRSNLTEELRAIRQLISLSAFYE